MWFTIHGLCFQDNTTVSTLSLVENPLTEKSFHFLFLALAENLYVTKLVGISQCLRIDCTMCYWRWFGHLRQRQLTVVVPFYRILFYDRLTNWHNRAPSGTYKYCLIVLHDVRIINWLERRNILWFTKGCSIKYTIMCRFFAVPARPTTHAQAHAHNCWVRLWSRTPRYS